MEGRGKRSGTREREGEEGAEEKGEEEHEQEDPMKRAASMREKGACADKRETSAVRNSLIALENFFLHDREYKKEKRMWWLTEKKRKKGNT